MRAPQTRPWATLPASLHEPAGPAPSGWAFARLPSVQPMEARITAPRAENRPAITSPAGSAAFGRSERLRKNCRFLTYFRCFALPKILLPYLIWHHPSTGQCLHANEPYQSLTLPRQHDSLVGPKPKSEVIMSPASATSTRANQPRASLGYAWYVVIILTALYMLSFVDRTILSLLVGSIKRDLGISDTRVGLLQGLSFALFYTIMGLPLGRLADTRSRRNLIAAGVVIWSIFTGACSIAKSFWSLFFTRIGVGVGEAGLSPAAYSLISDYFPPEMSE